MSTKQIIMSKINMLNQKLISSTQQQKISIKTNITLNSNIHNFQILFVGVYMFLSFVYKFHSKLYNVHLQIIYSVNKKFTLLYSLPEQPWEIVYKI